MVNFASVLDTKVADVERPPNMPIGTYQWQVSKIPETGSFSEGKWEYVDFALRCLGPTEDVDEDLLSEYGDPTRRTLRRRFMFNTEDEGAFKQTLYQLRTFCESHLEIDNAAKMTFKELLNESVGAQCLGTVKWNPDKRNPEVIYDEIGRTAPIA